MNDPGSPVTPVSHADQQTPAGMRSKAGSAEDAEGVIQMSEQPLTTHGACGKTWKQRGNRTGHCGKCHETFEGLALFDAHQAIQPNGSVICADPAVMVFRKNPLRLVNGTWRGPAMPKGTFGGTS